MNGNDSGPGSLRQAILDANANGEADTITFAPDVITVTLTSAQLLISADLTIDGGAGVTVERDGAAPDFRIFAISGNDTEVTLDSLTIRNGNANNNFGGGISNNGGDVTVSNSTLSGNSATNGGGIFNTGTLNVTSSTISSNSASGTFGGGGIYNDSGGTVTVENSTLSGNTATNGGGIYYFGRGEVTVQNSTITGNSASFDGGGIANVFGDVTVTNSTLSGNEAGTFGGGIRNFGGTATLTNTIVANSPNGGDVANNGTLTAVGNNIISDTSVSDPNITNGTDPQLGPLQDNGGPTLTHTPQAGSPAIDAGDNTVATNAGLTTDQRGFARQINGGTSNTVDIGAVEVQQTCYTQADDGSTTTDFSSVDAQALRDALAVPNVTTVDVAGFCGGTVTTAEGDNVAVISDPVTVQGGYPVDFATSTPDFSGTPDPDTNETVLSAQQAGRVLFVNNSTGTVTLDSLTIRNGSVIGNGGGIANFGTVTVANSTLSGNFANGSGGGISNLNGDVTVANSTLSGNTADLGGGISNLGGMLTVTDSTLSGNEANNDGGGIDNVVGELNVTNSTLSGNTADGGGGIRNSGGTLNVTTSTLSGNTANGGGGGGIFNFGSGSTLAVTNSTISGNTTTSFGSGGGGIFNFGNGSTLAVTNSTISGNTANGGGGGGIFNIGSGSTLNVTNSTISGNSAASFVGGGIANDSGTATIANSIVANNTDSSGDNDVQNNDTVTALGNNIVETAVTGSGTLNNPTNINNTDPQLGPLQDNGGPTLTHLPDPATSPAVDVGDNAVASGLMTDQRGFARIVGGTVDIGAVEVGAGDIAYSIALQPTSVTEGASGAETTATVTVTRSRVISETSSVDVGLGGTADEGTDYTFALASGNAGSFDGTTLSFAAGETEASFTISVQGDDVVEGDEDVTVALANATAPETATITPPDTVTLTIQDDDTAGVTVTPTEVTVSESGTTATYDVVLNTQPTADVEVSVTSSDTGEATANPTTLTFTPANWNTPQTVTVSAVDDSEEEGNHTGTISHSASSSDANYNDISIASVSVTVQDDDGSDSSEDLIIYLPLIAR